MKGKIIAFYDVLLYAIICGPLMTYSIYIFCSGYLFFDDWIYEYWYLVILFAAGIGIPAGGLLLIRRCEFELDTVQFVTYPLTFSWEKASHNIDIEWNYEAFLSEIASVEIVKLTKDEKKSKVYWKHLFNKYLKINLKYGATKYVYIAHYSNAQIKKIIKLLTQKAN
ncbi:MAG: hypothetical protein IJY13_03210 [Clostridia bacterium]|nr:hypothetical protein [Clostridia bacterium]